MAKPKNFWIKERDNPQFPKPYYVAMGSLSKKKALEHERPIYGSNSMLSFSTEKEYLEKIASLKEAGFSVQY